MDLLNFAPIVFMVAGPLLAGYCITCGRQHEQRDYCPVTDKMRELFRAGKYRMPVPPVQAAYWREDDWIVWIDCHGQWEESNA